MSAPTGPLTATGPSNEPGTPHAAPKTLTVALIGNPNTGKSTLFNALTGGRARIGNFPGVTVEKKIGRFQHAGCDITLIDLPGTYSLAPRSADEMVSVDVLLGRQRDLQRPDAIVCIVDSTNLERNLYLFTQMRDLAIPVVLVLNMWDAAEQRGIEIDVGALQSRLGVNVVTASAHRREGIDQIRNAIIAAATRPDIEPLRLFPDAFYNEVEQLRGWLSARGQQHVPFYLSERMLLDVHGEAEHRASLKLQDDLSAQLADARKRLLEAGVKIPLVETRVRYDWIRKQLNGVVRQTQPAGQQTSSDRIDRWLTHWFTGLSFFLVLMFVIFQAIYAWAGPLMEGVEALQGWLSGLVQSSMAPGMFRSLIMDGAIAGVGAVVVFLPQIILLFLFIAILEDCGYMARAAFLMDKLMTRVGLSGKSFLPLMSSFACAIPGVMATRVIENRRDRLTTMLIAPLMSCSARLPVYLLMIAAFIPATTYLGGVIGLQGMVLFGMQTLGALVAIPVAWLLKKTLLKGETPPFVMELPPYKWPSPRIVLDRVYDRAMAFLKEAGTLIFAVSVLVWAAGYFPGDHSTEQALQAEREQYEADVEPQLSEIEELGDRLDELADQMLIPAGQGDPLSATERQQLVDEYAQTWRKYQALEMPIAARFEEFDEQLNPISGELIRTSYLGRAGEFIEPAVRPLGWDWRLGVGAIASFPAREVIIATLGTIFSLGGEVDEGDTGLMGALQSATWPDGRPLFTIPVALSVMVFFALCAQCGATLMVIRRETNSWRWPFFTFGYMTALAYVAAFVVYQVGSRIF